MWPLTCCYPLAPCRDANSHDVAAIPLRHETSVDAVMTSLCILSQCKLACTIFHVVTTPLHMLLCRKDWSLAHMGLTSM